MPATYGAMRAALPARYAGERPLARGQRPLTGRGSLRHRIKDTLHKTFSNNEI